MADLGFRRGGDTNHKNGSFDLIFAQIFIKNCIKTFWSVRGRTSLAPLIGSISFTCGGEGQTI